MFLKTLEIYGFKSFPEKTLLSFDPGITVIVGPNGCGKSNVFDAIKWALGEQRPKSMRGSKMEDVIFNGTVTHPALNYTEVTLVFNNEDRYLPIDFKEVAISRRLYRTGESQYFINKNVTRLKDVQELFMGTGIGESSYSFIEQGKVDALLGYKPEEKRLIFDEAAGIGKYKEKKKETLRKLQETDDNILRLDDIIAEVKRQIRYLERQVEKAKKYKEVNQSLIVIEKKHAVIRLRSLEEEISKVRDVMKEFQVREQEKESFNQEQARQWEMVSAELKQCKEALDAATQQLITQTSQIDNYKNHIEINHKRIKETNQRQEYLAHSISDLSSRVSMQKERIEEERCSVRALDESIARRRGELQEIVQKKDEKNAQVTIASGQIEQAKKDILQFEQEKVQASNLLIEVGAYLKNCYARKKRLLLDKAKLEEYTVQRENTFSTLQIEVNNLEEQVGQLKIVREQFTQEIESLEAVMSQLQQEKVEREKEMVELNSYLEFLRDLKIKYDEFPHTRQVSIVLQEPPGTINKLIASLKDVHFQEVTINDKVCYQAQVEAKIISLPEDELVRRLHNVEEQVKNLVSQIEEKGQALQDVKQRRQTSDRDFEEKDIALRKKIQERDTLGEELNRFQEETSLLGDELTEVLEDIRAHELQQEAKGNEVNSLDEKLGQLKSTLEENQNQVDACIQERNQLEVQYAKLEAELNSISEQKNALLSKIALLEEELENLLASIESCKREQENSQGILSELEQEIVQLQQNINHSQERIAVLEQSKREKEDAVYRLEKEVNQISSHIKEIERELEMVREAQYAKKLEIQKFEYEQSKITDYLKQVYNLTLVLEEEEVPTESLEELEEARDKLRKKMKSLGEVNLVAIEEFEELNARFNFLNSQREDLLLSKDNLRKAIQKINRTSKEIFMDIFTKIEKEFKQYFRFLFGGGKAQLILLDPDNVLESGVEIEVQPPGKKLQIVSLLSGGEKALTAIALIFSIFKIRPSPLCVLDEIDAPLDEANVDRFNQLTKEFSPHAQFIIITHNKRTMSRADVLYGVTMQEKGVSKVVSVRFSEEQEQGHAPAENDHEPSVNEVTSPST